MSWCPRRWRARAWAFGWPGRRDSGSGPSCSGRCSRSTWLVAALLVFAEHAIVSDAWSRVASAHAVLNSRDPHLAATGFVWSPLPTLALIPLVAPVDIWPALVRDGFAASILSALAMAAAVIQFWGTLLDWGLARPWRIGLTLAFALHPMTVLFGANGNSEGLFLLTVILTVRYFSRWLESRELVPLVVAGVAMSLAYLTRYEAGAAALLAMAIVFAVSYARTVGAERHRAMIAAADVVVFGFPGRRGRHRLGARELADHRLAFEQFTSAYGVSAQIAAAGGSAPDGSLIVRQIHGLQPFAFVIVAVVAVLAVWRRDHRVLAPLGVLGGVLLFVALAWVTERTLGWIRYSIAIVPLVSLMLALAVARLPVAETPTLWPGSSRRLLRVATAALAAVVLLAGYATTVDTWRDPDVGRTDLYVPGAWEKAGAVATYLDELGLRPGSVLMDNFFGYSVFARSERPTQFVVTSDRDFASVLADPVAAGVSHIVVPRPSTALASLDAISRAYPGIYDDGAGIGTVVAEFDTHDHTPVWRVLAVTPAP